MHIRVSNVAKPWNHRR